MILTHLFLLRLQSFRAQIPRELLVGECKRYWNLSSQINSIFNAIHCFNPLTPKSDQHPISPHNIILESNIKVMRIKEMITNLRSS